MKKLEWQKAVSPAGAVFSSASDMGKYLELELNSGLMENGERFISEANILHRRTPKTEYSFQSGYRYALGWLVGKDKGLENIQHGGNAYSYKSQLSFFPEKKLGMVILTNGEGGDKVYPAIEKKIMELWFNINAGSDISLENLSSNVKDHDELCEQVIEEDPLLSNEGFAPTSEQKHHLDKLVGAYHNDFIGKVHIAKVNGIHVFKIDGGQTIPIKSATEEGGDEFEIDSNMMKIVGKEFSINGGRDEFDYVFTPSR